MPRLDVDQADLAAVEPSREIGAGREMGVIKAAPRWARREGDAPRAMGRDERRALFRGPVYVSRQELPVPMQLFRRVGVVVDIDNDALSLRQA